MQIVSANYANIRDNYLAGVGTIRIHSADSSYYGSVVVLRKRGEVVPGWFVSRDWNTVL